VLSARVAAQKENPLLRQGNNLYDKGNYKEAEKDYRKALELNKESIKGKFNLGQRFIRKRIMMNQPNYMVISLRKTRTRTSRQKFIITWVIHCSMPNNMTKAYWPIKMP